MGTSINNLGYNTGVVDSIKSIINCLDIILYDSGKLETEKLTLFNVENVYKELVSNNSEGILNLSRDVPESSFGYLWSDFSGFDTIMYVDEGRVLGYTEFLTLQGVFRDLDIDLSFKGNILDSVVVNLGNSLSQIEKVRDLTGEGLGQFTKVEVAKEILGNLSDNDIYPRYTKGLSTNNIPKDIRISDGSLDYRNTISQLNLVEKINSDLNNESFFGHSALIGNSLVKLGIGSRINLNIPDILENKIVGIMGKELVLYTWSGTNYSIHSLMKNDRFGNPRVIARSEPLPRDRDFKVSYFSGKYLVAEGNEGVKMLFDLYKKSWVINSNLENFILDIWNPKSNMIILPRLPYYEDVLKEIPDFRSTYLSKRSSVNVINKIGDWFVIKERDNRTGRHYKIYSNFSKAVYTSEEEVPIIINNRAIAVPYQVDSGEYYTIFDNKASGIFFTELAKTIRDDSKLVYNEKFNIMVSESEGVEDYKNGKLNITHVGDPLVSSCLCNFRRGLLPSDLKVPKISTTLPGLIFYEEGNYLKYL